MLREMGFEPSFIGVLNQQECADIIDFIDKWWLIGAERGWLKPSVVGWALLKWWVEDGDLAKQIQGTGYNSEIKAMKNHLIWGWIYDTYVNRNLRGALLWLFRSWSAHETMGNDVDNFSMNQGNDPFAHMCANR
jgi:hypothetical protein